MTSHEFKLTFKQIFHLHKQELVVSLLKTLFILNAGIG